MARQKVVSLIIGAAFLILLLALFNLQVIQGIRLRQLSSKNCIRFIPQPGMRGKIFDRNQLALVDNVFSYDVLLMPGEEQSVARRLLKLSEITNTALPVLEAAYRENYLAEFMPVEVIRDIAVKKAMRIEEAKFDLEGIIVNCRPKRHYLYPGVAAHVIGYLGEIDRWRLTRLTDYGYNTKDIVGFGGVEEWYDYYLRQEDGAQSVNVDHQGRFVRLVGFKPPKNGKDIVLTLDLRIQKITDRIMKGLRGCAIIMDPANGEILSLASKPDFAASVFADKQPQEIEKTLKAGQSPLLNRAISGAYPAASVFKLVMACLGIEEKKINFNTQFDCKGSLKIGNRVFSCWDVHGKENLRAALAHSCDIFFYHLGLLSGAQLIHDYALKFGLGRPTGIDLPEEDSGFVPSPLWRRFYKFQKWYDGDTANFAIGQGELLVTPLQLVRLIAAFANAGELVSPYVAKSIDGKEIIRPKKRQQLPVKEDTLRAVSSALRAAVNERGGTAGILAELPLAVSGKTGTAQASHGQPHGWFAGFFPYENPKFVLCVFLEHGGSGYNACIVARRIIEEMITEGLV